MNVGVISTGSIPFIVRNGDKYSGIAIEIWEKIAKKLNIKFKYIELPHDEDLAIQKVKSKDVDILVGPFNITEKRYKDVDFTIPFYKTNFCFASAQKNDYLQTYIDISKSLLHIAFFFLLVLFINNITKNFTKNANIFNVIVNSIPTFNKFDKSMWFLYFVVFICIIIIYINSFKPSFSFSSNNFLLKNKSVLYSDTNKIQTIVDKYNMKGNLISFKNSADHLKQTKNDPLLDNYINDIDNIDGILGECSKISYVLNHNSDKYKDIQIIRNNLSRELYSFVLPKESKILDKINSSIRQHQEEKINQMIVTKYLGPEFQNYSTF